MSRRKQPHPKHIENEQQVASFLDNNGTSAVSPKRGYGDAHVCGKCRAEFVDLAEFLSHKKCCSQQIIVCSEEDQDKDCEVRSPDRELQEGEVLTDTTTDLSATAIRDTADVNVDPSLELLKQERKDDVEDETGSLNEDADDIDDEDDIEDEDEDFDDSSKLSNSDHPFAHVEEQTHHSNPHLQQLYAISTSPTSRLGTAETTPTSSTSISNTMRMSPEQCTDKHSPILNGTDKDAPASAYDLNSADFLRLDDGRKCTPESPSSQLPHFPVPYSTALLNGTGGNVIIEPLSETRAAVAQFAEANNISPGDMASLRASIYGLQQQATAFIQCVNMFEERFMAFASSFGEGAAAAAAGLHLPNGPASLSPSLAPASTGAAPTGLPAITGSGLNAAGQSPLDGSAGSMDLVTTTVNCSMRQTTVVSKAGGHPLSSHSAVPICYPQTHISSTGQHHPHSQSHHTNQLHSNLTSLTSSHPSTMDYHPYQGLVHHPSFGHAHGFRHKCKYCQKLFSNELSLQVHVRSHTGDRPYRCNVCNIKFSCKSALRLHFGRHKSHLQLPQQPLPAHSAARNAALLSSRFQFQPMSLTMSSVAVNLPAAGVPIMATASPTLSSAVSRAPLLDAAPASISQSLIREGESPSLKLEKPEPKLGEGATDSVSLHAVANNNSLTNNTTPGVTGAETPTSVLHSIGLPTALSSSSPQIDPSSASSVIAAAAAITASNSSFAAAVCSPAITTTSTASHIPLSASRNFSLLPPLTVVPHPPMAPLPPHFNTSSHGPPPPPPPPPPLTKPDLRSMPGGLFPPAKHIEPGENVEDYMEVNTSETSKLQKFVENIEHKLSDPNECAICHRVLSCKSALQMHYRIHTGERPFRCKLCGRAFTTKGNLKTHMGVHRAKPPTRLTHQCPVCHKQFTNILVLQQHIRGHTSDTYPSMPPSLYRASEWHPKPFDLRPHLEPRELDLSKTAPSFSHHPILPSTTSPSPSLNSTSPVISPMDNGSKISPGSLDMTQKVLDATGSIDGSGDRNVIDGENSIMDASGVIDSGDVMDEGMMDDSVVDSDAADDGVMDTSVMDDNNMMDGSLVDSNLMDTDDLDGEKLSVTDRKVDGDVTKVDDWIESKTPTASTTPTLTTATPAVATTPTKKEDDWAEPEDSQTSSDAAHEALDEDRPNSMASIGSHESPELHKIHNMHPMSSYESHINSVITSGFVPPSSTSLAALEARVRAINSNNPLSMTVGPKFDLRMHPRDLNPMHKQFSPHLPHHSAFLNGDGSTGTSPHSLGNDALSDSNGLKDAASMHLRPDVPGFPMSSVFPLAPALDLRPRNVEGKANTTCYICFKTFACKSALDIHIRSHTKERPFKCEVCDRSFSTKGNMKQHMLTHKIRDLPSQFKSRNGSSSSSSSSSSNHNNNPATSNNTNTSNNSNSEAPVKSEQSGESEANRAAPSVSATNNSGSGNGNGTSTSSSSSNSSNKPTGNGDNSETHNNQGQNSQPQISQPQISPSSEGNSTSPFVRRSSPKHTCSVCQKQFSSASALQIHIRTHTGDKPFKCNMCAKAFTTKGNLKVHMGTHMWGNNPSRRGRRMSIEPPFLIGPKEQHYLSPYHRSPDFLFHQYPHFLNGLSPKMNEISVIQSLNGSMNHLQNHLPEVSKEELPRSDSVGGRSSIESDRKSTESLPSSWPNDTLSGLNLAHHHHQQQAALILSQQQQQQQQQHHQQQQSPNGSSNSSINNHSIAAQNLEGGGLGLGVAPSSHDLLLASGLSGELDLSMKSAASSISPVVSGHGTGVNTAVGGANGGSAGVGGSVTVSGGGSSAVSTADSTASSPPPAPPSVSPPPALATTPNSDRDLVSGGMPTTPMSAPDTHQSVGAWSWRTICHVCNQVFPTSSSLDHHLRTHHHANPTEEPLRTSVSN